MREMAEAVPAAAMTAAARAVTVAPATSFGNGGRVPFVLNDAGLWHHGIGPRGQPEKIAVAVGRPAAGIKPSTPHCGPGFKRNGTYFGCYA